MPEELKPLTAAFAKTFPGLQANYQRYIGDKLDARLDGEYASGKHSADLLLQSFIDVRGLKAAGRLAPLDLPDPEVIDPQYRDPRGDYVAVYQKTFVVAYNPNSVPEAQVRRTIAQIVDPRWKDRYAFPSAGNVSGGTGDTPLSILTARNAVDDGAIRQLFANGTAGPPTSELLPALAQGRYAFAIWVNAAAVQAQADRGAPLRLVFPPDLSFLANVDAAILDKAPHPISSRLFVAWLLTPAAQQALARLNFYPTAKSAPIPAGYPARTGYLNGAVPEDDAWADRVTRFHAHRLAITR